MTNGVAVNLTINIPNISVMQCIIHGYDCDNWCCCEPNYFMYPIYRSCNAFYTDTTAINGVDVSPIYRSCNALYWYVMGEIGNWRRNEESTEEESGIAQWGERLRFAVHNRVDFCDTWCWCKSTSERTLGCERSSESAAFPSPIRPSPRCRSMGGLVTDCNDDSKLLLSAEKSPLSIVLSSFITVPGVSVKRERG